MRRITGVSAWLGGLILVGGLRGAAAQASLPPTAGFDPELFAASMDPDAVSVVDGARTLTRGSLAVALFGNVSGAVLPLCLRGGAASELPCEAEGDVVRARVRAELGVLYGLGRVDVRLALPLVLHQTSDFVTAGGDAIAAAGLGDPRVAVRVRLARTGVLDVAGDLAVALPAGGGDFIGDDGPIVEPRALVDMRARRLAVALAAGYRYRREKVSLADLDVGDELTWSAGAEYAVVPARLALGAAAYGRIGLDSDDRPAELAGSARVFLSRRTALELAGGTGLTDGHAAPAFRVIAGLRWLDRKPEHPPPDPRVVDRDRDGIVDANDRCPDAAEDRDGFQDTDGCPEPDNDRDGVPDAADRCPDIPEDVDNVDDADGCPDTDDDHDGVEDAFDACPGEAEDRDQVDDDDGCPETDADRDGIADEDDKCPSIPELYDGVADEDGCPDDARARPTVEVQGQALVVGEKLFFDLDRAELKPASGPALAAVAAFLAAHPAIHLRVEGHADDTGKRARNLELSRQRAEAVRAKLVELGVAAERLEAQGFGDTRPLVRGRTDAARAKNRRVELVITAGG